MEAVISWHIFLSLFFCSESFSLSNSLNLPTAQLLQMPIDSAETLLLISPLLDRIHFFLFCSRRCYLFTVNIFSLRVWVRCWCRVSQLFALLMCPFVFTNCASPTGSFVTGPTFGLLHVILLTRVFVGCSLSIVMCKFGAATAADALFHC